MEIAEILDTIDVLWYSGYGDETDVSLDCDRFYEPFVCPWMRMSDGVNERINE
jgi:hypothetical protein